MKLKGVVCLIASGLLIFSGCSPVSTSTGKRQQSKFYKPQNWDKPFVQVNHSNSSSKTSESPFKPDFAPDQILPEPHQTNEFQPDFSAKPPRSKTNFQPLFEEKKKTQPIARTRENSREQMDGIASWYGPNFHGKLTANGERYNQNAMTAAHKFLPINTRLRVTNMENGRYIVVRINDRGPYVDNRIIDMTHRGAKLLGFLKKGTARVRLDVVKFPASYDPAKGLKPYKQVVIQLAVFRDRNRAGDFKSQLSRRYNSIKFLVDKNSKGAYHVVAGPYDSRAKAKQVARNFKSDGVNSFVRSYRK